MSKEQIAKTRKFYANQEKCDNILMQRDGAKLIKYICKLTYQPCIYGKCPKIKIVK